MGKKIRGAALRAKKRAKEAELDLVATAAQDVETGRVTSKPNAELFVLDTKAAVVPKQEQQTVSAVTTTTRTCATTKKPRVQDEKVQALLAKHDSATLQKMASATAATNKHNRNNKRKTTTTFDLWEETSTETTAPVIQAPPAKRMAGIAPPHLVKTKVAPMSSSTARNDEPPAVAVDVAQSGQSYHPDPYQHQNVIGEALALELRRKEAEDYRDAPISSGMSDETKALLLGDDDGDGSNGNSSDEEDDEPLTLVLHKQQGKLTRAQRNRQKRIRAEQKELHDRKVARKRLNAIAEAKTLSKQLAKEESLQQERRAHVAALKKEQRRTLGTSICQRVSETNPLHAPTLPVALTDDLLSGGGTLRTMKPKGSLLTDRMESYKDRKMTPAKHVGDRKRIVQGNKRRRKVKLKVKAKGQDIRVKDERGRDYLLMG